MAYVARVAVVAVISMLACGPDPFAGLAMGPRKTKLHERILAKELSNGLQVVLVPDARTNLVAVGMHYDVGGADDPPEDLGLAHYAEHVVYDVAYRGDGAALAGVALEENALTSSDRTYFYASALDVDLDRLLEAAARRLEARCEDFDEAALARERDVVIEEAKERARYQWGAEGLMTALWGATHPYGRSVGATSFTDVSRDKLCAFIAKHYGPSTAVLVVTGNVRDEHWVQIRRRFETIQARVRTGRDTVPAVEPVTVRATLPGLKRPTVMLAFPVAGEGSEFDAVAEVLQGARWELGDGVAHASVIGERRARVLAVYGETADAKQLGALEAALRDAIRRQGIPSFEHLKERARVRALAELDGTLSAGMELASTAARRQPVTRFRTLNAVDKLTVGDALRWIDLAKAKVVVLLPEVGVEGTHRVSELTTTLHHLDVVRSPPGELPALTPKQARVTDYRLANGLRVLLAADVDSLGFDARLVIETPGDRLARQAALLLEPDNTELGPDGRKRIGWYQTIGTPIRARVDDRGTTFQIASLSTFGDWHVWFLAWTVLRGHYPWWLNQSKLDRPEAAKQPKPEPPSAVIVVRSRLAGEPDEPKRLAWPSTSQLETVRRSSHRPEVSTLIVTGTFDVAAMRREIETLFGGWRGGKQVARKVDPSPGPRIRSFVAIPAKSTTIEIAIGFAPGKATRSERVARSVLNELLADRLRVIREGLGVSYGVSTMVDEASVIVGGSVEPAFAKDAAAAIMAELARVRDGGPALDADFARARRRVLARALARPLGPSVRAQALQELAIEHRPVGDLGREIDEIRTLDRATFQRIVVRELRNDLMLAAVRGEETMLEPVLRILGATTIQRLPD